ncbi:NAD(P)-dependent oxidoreductase [Hymenobacter sp. APR13]|uniref:NAD(P)-dependent oxidoreductase n=1 Tax=Hymenobacter sp. APR13 TaxID=1356852 RepID=UPI0004E07E6A|nr:NAD(P)H-binding protein [Hymenobacter sp. APR13]AII50681.1 hypothetical protein N008_01610 [Hymenobacter sp. APR13]
MQITILGATAGVGLQAVQQALAGGHTVTALARTTASLPDHPRLRKLNGSATVVADVRQAIAGADAVLITIGTKNKKATTLYSDAARALLAATADTHFTAPVLAITGFGIGPSAPYLNWLMRLVVKGLLRKQSADKEIMEQLLAHSALNWEIVQPGILSDGPPTHSYRVLTDLHPGMKVGKIARADVAHFLLQEAARPRRLRQRTVLTS